MTIEEAEKMINASMELVLTVAKQMPNEMPPMAAFRLGCVHAEIRETLRLIKTQQK